MGSEPWSYHPDDSPVYSLAANLNGGSLLLEQPPDTLGVLRMLVDRKVTHAAVVPTVLQRLLALPEYRTADWSALRYVVYGASPIPLPVRSRRSRPGREVRVPPAFGRAPRRLAAHRRRRLVRRRGLPVPARPAQGHDRLRGENVYPAEVESVMTGHPAVAEVAVVGVPSADWGESPYAVVVLRPGAQVTPDELISWTRDRLAHYKCPAGVSFAPALARTASGKLQKQAIRSSLGSLPAPKPARGP